MYRDQEDVIWLRTDANSGDSQATEIQLPRQLQMTFEAGPYRRICGTTWEKWSSTIWKKGITTDVLQHYIYCIPNQEPSPDMPIRGEVAIYIKMWTMYMNNAMFYVISDNVIITRGINGCMKPQYFEKAFFLPTMKELALE